MYLTRFAFNRQRRGARELLASPYKMHAAVESCFPPPGMPTGAGKPAGAPDDPRVLWRVDFNPSSTLLYLVSPALPDLTHLVEQAGWPAAGQGWETRDYSRLLDGLQVGQTWAFRLTANPVRRVRLDHLAPSGQPGPGALVGKRVGHVTVGRQTDWLVTRASKLGFALPLSEGLPQLAVTSRQKRQFAHGPRGRVTITMATFDGVLTVEDPAALRRALVGGIGPGKAFGCGLMTLARVPG